MNLNAEPPKLTPQEKAWGMKPRPWTCVYCKIDFRKNPRYRPTANVMCWNCYHGPVDEDVEHWKEQKRKKK